MFNTNHVPKLPNNENVTLSEDDVAEIIGRCIESIKEDGQEINIQQIMAEYQDFPPEFKENLRFAITLEILFSQVNEQASKHLTPDILTSAEQLMRLRIGKMLFNENKDQNPY